jgi:hypothetical protein
VKTNALAGAIPDIVSEATALCKGTRREFREKTPETRNAERKKRKNVERAPAKTSRVRR